MHYKETEHGFEWGAAKLVRLATNEDAGEVVFGITTPRRSQCVQIHVTKAGNLRVFKVASGEEMKPLD